MKRLFLIAISAAIGLWLAVALTVFLNQRDMLFPRHLLPPVSRPETLPRDVREVTVETADGERLYGLWKPPAPGCSVIVTFHGNAAVPGRAAARFSKGLWAAHGWGVLATAYRGYPGSTGTPSETGLLADGNAAIAFVRNAAASSPILVHGHSMGTGVAVAMAAVHPVIGVYLEAPYASLLGLAKRQYQYLPGFLMLDPMRSDLRIGAVRAPILAIHGKQDAVIPLTSARELMARAPANARLIEVDGDHESIVGMADAEAEERFRSACPKGAATPIATGTSPRDGTQPQCNSGPDNVARATGIACKVRGSKPDVFLAVVPLCDGSPWPLSALRGHAP